MLNIKISLVTSSGLLLASKPESVDDTQQILATGLMTALISFSKEVHHRELQAISYHDRKISFLRIFDFVLIVETLAEEEVLSEEHIKQLLEHLHNSISPLLETANPDTITEGEADLILENSLQELSQLQYSIAEQPFTVGDKTIFKLKHLSKGWEIADEEGDSSLVQKITPMLETYAAQQQIQDGITSIITQIPKENCSTFTIIKTEGDISRVGILKLPRELDLTLFRLFPLVKKTIERLHVEDEGNFDYILTSIMDLEDPGSRLSKFNLEDISPSFLDKTLGKNIDKVLYSTIVGDGILVVGDKPTVRLIIDALSIMNQHLHTSVNVWINSTDLTSSEKYDQDSRICGVSSQIYNTIKVKESLIAHMITVNLATGNVEATKSSTYFKKLFDATKKLKVNEMSTKIVQELEKLALAALTITSFCLVDKKQGKEKLKEFTSKSEYPVDFMKKALELAIKMNPLLDYLQ
ncbi:MAG: hypothetical protein ACTSVO_01225 [Candidatus Heimdallarchaeaceae archaeon]